MNENEVEKIEEDKKYVIEGVRQGGDVDNAYVSLNA